MNIQQGIIDAPEPQPVGYLYTNVQSGESHVSDYDDDYRGPERALWCIEPVYRATPHSAPQPPKLSDERIFDLLKQVDPYAVRLPLGFKQFAIAIEREILGENNDCN